MVEGKVVRDVVFVAKNVLLKLFDLVRPKKGNNQFFFLPSIRGKRRKRFIVDTSHKFKNLDWFAFKGYFNLPHKKTLHIDFDVVQQSFQDCHHVLIRTVDGRSGLVLHVLVVYYLSVD